MKIDSLKWETKYESSAVLVELATDWLDPKSFELVALESAGAYLTEFWRVTPTEGRQVLYYGESAWSDAKRMASDFDFSAYWED